MKKNIKWPRPRKMSDFLVVPLPKQDAESTNDASFGDFNAPLNEQAEEDGKTACPQNGNGE
jgi:hypothetical protein